MEGVVHLSLLALLTISLARSIWSGVETREELRGVLEKGYKFDITDDAKETWNLLWGRVRAALKQAGHHERLTLENVNHVSCGVPSVILGVFPLAWIYPR